jgi:aerobic-type carbon monoxide dehydrogenase small subunit (CoxS/CutS family)
MSSMWEVHRTLLEVLRENLELTGTKKGCKGQGKSKMTK